MDNDWDRQGVKDRLYEQLPDSIPEENRQNISQLVHDMFDILNNNDLRDIHMSLTILHNFFTLVIESEHGGTVH